MNNLQSAIEALAAGDAHWGSWPNPSATDVQRQVTGRPVNFDTLTSIYDAYDAAFWVARSSVVTVSA